MALVVIALVADYLLDYLLNLTGNVVVMVIDVVCVVVDLMLVRWWLVRGLWA